MELQVGVKVCLRNKKGQYLLVKRSPDKYPEVGAKWDIVGGRINPGTPLLDNLKREIEEEVKLELKTKVKLIFAQDILRIPGRHVVRLTYVGHINGKPKLDGDHIEYGWFTKKELKKIPNRELDTYFKEVLDKNLIP
jgi:ADP-ribose pyrophosphatase YjhB (NUDIX family)